MRYALLVFVLAAAAQAQETNPRRELREHLLESCKKHFDARRDEVASLKTPEDIRRRQETLKRKFLESLGPMPEKTPLNSQVVGTLKGDGFRVEKIVFESRPNHHVTANLYLPDAKGAVPGVIVPCGHSGNGKAAEAYQRACILMAKNGIAALCYDPIGQGERRQLLNDDGKPGIKSLTDEHTLVGIGAWLVGQSTASYRIWDGIRALDYLASRPEIDAQKLGCAGNSGGGTLTAYLMALDDRIACAVPSCSLTTLEKLFATIGPQDAEQNIVGQVAFGMEHADFVTLRAPKPTLIATATQDFFNIEGSKTTFQEVKALYEKLGAGERVHFYEFDDKHGWSKPRREAAVQFLRKWLAGVDGPVVEPAFPVFSDAQLQCTRSGQALTDFKGLSAFQMNVMYADQARAKRDEFVRSKDLGLVRRRLGIGESPAEGNRLSGFQSTLSANDRPTHFVIGLPESRGKDPFLLARENTLVNDSDAVAFGELTLRGLGGPPPKGSVYFSYDFPNAMLGLHLDRPLLGQRVDDIRDAIHRKIPEKGAAITLVAEGLTGPAALHAAALDPRIGQVTLVRSIVSWENVVRTPLSGPHLDNVVPGVLQHYDLPQLAATLAPRPLTLRGVVDASGKTMAIADVEAAYAVCRQAYEKLGASKNFRIEPAK